MPVVPPLYRNPETGGVEGYNMLFLGQRGMGKTYLVGGDPGACALDERENVVVHDPKRTFRHKPICEGSEWDRCETFDAVFRSDKPKICYSPSRAELHDRTTRDDFCEWVYRRGNTTFYADEGTQLFDGAYDAPPGIEDGYSTGRESGLEIWVATQQPVELPSLVWTQSQVFYIFYCALTSHRQKIAGFAPVSPDQIAALKKTQFYYYKDDERAALGPYALREGELEPA